MEDNFTITIDADEYITLIENDLRLRLIREAITHPLNYRIDTEEFIQRILGIFPKEGADE